MKNLKKGCYLLLGLLISCQGVEQQALDLTLNPDSLEIFAPNRISTYLYERDLAISPEGTEVIFTLGDYKQTIRSLVSLQKNASGWSGKRILPFSGRYNDIEPFFSPDGKTLYFASDRPLGVDSTHKDYNIWKVQKTPTGWDSPEALDTVINTAGDEFFPSVSSNGNLYFTATRDNGIGREDIFVSTFQNDTYAVPVPLDTTINTTVFEFNAYVSPEEDLLVFSAFGRQDGLGGGDLYWSKKKADGSWEEAQNFGTPINSPNLDYCPLIDIARGNFYFTSERVEHTNESLRSLEAFQEHANRIGNGLGNIYRISIEHTGLSPDN